MYFMTDVISFGGDIMGTLFTISIAALLVVGAQFWYTFGYYKAGVKVWE